MNFVQILITLVKINMKTFNPNTNFFYYLYYIQERMNIFWNRLKGLSTYTEDIIFLENKFTNAYRVLDRSSQYLLRNVIYINDGKYTEEDIVWRIFLYKNYNLPSTWEYLKQTVGDITVDTPIIEIREALEIYESPVFSNAYMLTCAFIRKESFFNEYGIDKNYTKKFWLYLKIFRKELFDRGKIKTILKSKSFENLFINLSDILSFADFLSYQIAQDLNYTELFNFDDNSFCAAGLGTQRGIKRVFDINGKVDFGDVVKWTAENYDKLVEDYSNIYNIDLTAKQLPNWDFKVPDFSNAFCETDKYMRQLGVNSEGVKQGRMKQKFKPNNQKIDFFFPPKWGVGELKPL